MPLTTKPRETMWEQRLGALMQTLAVAVLVWVGNSTVSVREEVVSLKLQVANASAKLEQVQALQVQIREMEYTQKELMRRLAEIELDRDRKNGIPSK